MKTARNALLGAPPYQVEQALKKFGGRLKTARLRRNLTAQDVAEKIGTSRFAVADAERGKPSAGVAVYAALLWAYGLVGQIDDLADTARDSEGTTLSLNRAPTRASRGRKLSNDF
jgi:transcriptional regulator with XRE-family HTH domain